MMHAKTRELIETMYCILRDANDAGYPMTVRQVYYQLVAGQVIKNDRGSYQKVSCALVEARKHGHIPWTWIEDRNRRPRSVPMWPSLPSFVETCRHAFRLDVWSTQPRYLEVWLEKDALSGIFESVLEPYGVTLNVGRGYDGWDSIYCAAMRYDRVGRPVTILYYGDFDPSGEDMNRSLQSRLEVLGYCPEIIKCALTFQDIERYSLPPDFAKKTDTRAAAFIRRHGDVSVELDALPVSVLRARLEHDVSSRMDLDALTATRELEGRERARLDRLLIDVDNG
jgi:hypothetical protein